MEDHYVRAHTDRGSELVLLPLKAALAELEVEGLQVHRSWWVARGAVTGAIQDGRNLRLQLLNGLEAPVSRASIATLRQAGWLEDSRSLGNAASGGSIQERNGDA
jgi:DNA-binding LytR/AlgR family response regulator